MVERFVFGTEEGLGCDDRDRRIVCLVDSVQRQEQVGVDVSPTLNGDELAVDGPLPIEEAEVAFLGGQRNLTAGGFFVEDSLGGFVLDGSHGDRFRGRAVLDAAVEDSGLRRSDLLDGVTEERLMVEADLREHAHLSVGDVRRIPRSAHADLSDDDIDGGIGEHGEGQDGQCFEVGQLRAAFGLELSIDDLEVRGDLVIDAHEGPCGHGRPVHRDPFGHRVQVGTGEPADAEVVSRDERIDHPRRRCLPVRACDRDRRGSRVDVTEDLTRPPGRVEAQFDLRLPRPRQQQGIDAGEFGSRRLIDDGFRQRLRFRFIRGLRIFDSGQQLLSLGHRILGWRVVVAHARFTARRVPPGSSSGVKASASASTGPKVRAVVRVSPAMRSA